MQQPVTPKQQVAQPEAPPGGEKRRSLPLAGRHTAEELLEQHVATLTPQEATEARQWFAVARAIYKWPTGAELSKSQFEKALAYAPTHYVGGTPPKL